MSPARRGPLDGTVYDRALVSRRVRAGSILHESGAFHRNTSKRAFGTTSVGFLTPWAAERGDELVWRFGRKLTHVAPVLFDALPGGGVRSRLGDGAGRQWLRWLRSASRSARDDVDAPPPRLTPLVSLERLDLVSFFGDEDTAEQRQGQLLLSLQALLLRAKLDGFVLHAHAHLAGLSIDERRGVAPRLHLFVQLLAAQLSQEGGELLLLVPPHPGLFSAVQFSQLHPALAAVVVETANFSAVKGTPGPSAPITWMRRALTELQPTEESAPKLAVTLPMVGWDFELPDGRGTAVSAARYLGTLRRHSDAWLEWDAAGAEHVLRYSTADGVQRAVYYASLRGLAERLGVLRQLGVGAALELGGALDYFFDLL